MSTDTELDYKFDEPADDPHAQDDNKAADLIIRLLGLFERPVSTKSQLNTDTDILYQLESLHINHQSVAWSEVERLKRIWKTRLRAQDDVDRWMIEGRSRTKCTTFRVRWFASCGLGVGQNLLAEKALTVQVQ
jgi:hypothetical protein